jgi:L-asparaginase II
MPSAPLVQVVRSGLVESVHLGDVAVCDTSGRLLAAAGDPDHVSYVRSCMKPVQAAVSLAAIGADVVLSERQIAVMCASHNGEPVHIRTVRSVLRRGGVEEAALQTPPARPADPASAAGVRTPRPIFHNCSGKHAGMLVASSAAGWPLEMYRNRSHPLQRRVLRAVRSLSGIEPTLGVDGCGVPVHAMPLRAVATMYARLTDADNELADSFTRATEAMRAEPYLVGGLDRDDTAIMEATPDIVVKEGAEALDCAVILGAGIGIAVKIADGGYRAAGPALLAVLDQLGVLAPGARRMLRSRLRPAVLGGGRPVGNREPIFTLSRDRA